jgi:enoyl-CoA hydratase/carnithine racemase
MEYQSIRYEVADRIATITFDRPDRLNALSPEMIAELRRAYDRAEADPDVWILLVTGNGRAFCAGADVSEIPDDGRVVYEEPYLSTYEQWEAPQEGTPPFRTMTKPILTAVNGLCCGAGWCPVGRWCGSHVRCPRTSRCASRSRASTSA